MRSWAFSPRFVGIVVVFAGRCPSLRELPFQGGNRPMSVTQGAAQSLRSIALPWAMGSWAFSPQFVGIVVVMPYLFL